MSYIGNLTIGTRINRKRGGVIKGCGDFLKKGGGGGKSKSLKLIVKSIVIREWINYKLTILSCWEYMDYGLVNRPFPHIWQYVLSDCNSFPQFTQLVPIGLQFVPLIYTIRFLRLQSVPSIYMIRSFSQIANFNPREQIAIWEQLSKSRERIACKWRN